MVTRFECQRRVTLVLLHIVHSYVRREVRRKADGFIGVTTSTDWRSGAMHSISMWREIEDIYRMGEVRRHILAARLPGRLNVRTYSGIFAYAGDWRRVLFNSRHTGASPLTGWMP